MMPLLGAAAVDVTIVLALVLVAALVLHGRSAAMRHAILAAGVAGALAVPAIEQLVPVWEVPLPWGHASVDASTLRLTSSAPPAGVDVQPALPARAPIPWTDIALGIWAVGALVVFAGLFTGIVRLSRATRRCTVIASGPWRELATDLSRRARLIRPVVLLQSDDPSLLLTWGLFHPKILLPAGAAAWSLERRQVVLAHELAHIRRHDWTWQMAAETLRACHWFNPLVWIACHRLRRESEYACDDAVLDAGVEATEYASHLLEVARHAVGHGIWASAPAVANPSTLERRISAMLSHQRNRTPLTRRAGVMAAVLAALVTVPVAALSLTARVDNMQPLAAPGNDVALIAPATPPAPVAAPARRVAPPAAAPAAQQTPAAIAGRLQDPSGGVLPGVEMTLTDTEFGVRYTAVSDGTGAFAFRDLQPGRYELVARLPGFATVSIGLRLDAGAALERRLTLPLGTLEETITVVCSPGAAAIPGAESRFVVFSGNADDASILTRTRRNSWTRAAPPPPPDFTAQPQAVGAPVRVGGQIKAPGKVRSVNPICPRTLLPAADTVVNMVGTVGVDGFMNEVRLVEPKAGAAPPPPEFVESALDAVRQWAFTPTLLNNVAVPVNITITVLYRRG